ncbi:MAG TPA: hypothetical protein DCZ01_12935 [Elusimicrobia bacterium]|nr:MAG: hypothetical protein A2X37_04350 [Elusimicrobia bacterium GWA2_66_18]OGR73304.1 MAG: hypothetical protein A2X40_03700 [Elusimicrobia bacterium GWC2_65_9]HAZ09391.1 hypothetical protein [Elusimicrobiota bacterium]
MSAIDGLFKTPPFTRKPAHRALFIRALRDCAALQARRFPALSRLYSRAGFRPESLRRESDVARLPFLFISVFKEFDLRPVPPLRAALELTSSGTSGQKSRIRLDAGSLRRVVSSARSVYGALGMVDPALKTHYLCMTYDPRAAKDLGTAFTDELLTSFTARGEVFYALRWDPRRRDFFFDLDGVISALRRMAATSLPLRVLGFPAHVRFAQEEWARRRLPPLHFGPKSWVLTGGGWKGRQGAAITRTRFRADISSWLGLPSSNLRDLYGLVEHGIPYVECHLGRMHVPNYSRVLVRDPETLRILPPRAKGLLQLITPYLTSFPSFSVLTSDWGELKSRCSCGTPGQVLILRGRAVKVAAKGCALSAVEHLAR